MPAGKVVVVGSLNADLTVRTDRFPSPGETLNGSELVIVPGGKSANQAAAAAILGADVRLFGAVGADGHGDLLLKAAAGAGVDASRVLRRTGTATGTAMIVVDAAGENTIIVSPGANGTVTGAELPADLFDGAAVLTLSLEVPLEAVAAAARAGQQAGAQVLLNLSPYQEVPAELLALTDVLLLNTHEAALVTGLADPAADWEEVITALGALGVRRTIITLGADGAVVLDGTAAGSERILAVAPTRVTAVDTTGCGDAFTAATAARLAAGDSLAEAATFAARAGALAATREGAQSSYSALLELAG
ncbi:PfkB family carbohydrate kinase [Arthrobacter sp. zg-Y20]|uniref:PfkB family carbohydrate kinase n=1 Tax=unclassified Arthrobacter TaxID=235627 RepID=UPI001D1441EB|nr:MULTISPECIES: PfkB family carbohydrate kinase [unclassified Arthrobacter]MCC3276721.1 PfkB family carbohydrate kinase [Arthrobacter sp. zg-Y20]MDK1316880.1 PfkB family carbohydrate kinase [Arthrobacter sp. zg.Y20]WIB06710.1 PfkB family carbohydrate kinase [Arthrobacter sp. zg-Y20]